jgi:glutamate-5-semialdehyde dehydrogenase
MARALESAAEDLLTANARDMEQAAARTGGDGLPGSALSRLALNEAKLRDMIEQVRSVAALPDPLGRALDAIELDDADPFGVPTSSDPREAGLHLQKVSVPLGVLAVIFEARPDAVTQIAALALKSGNSAILKAGREVERTAAALVGVLRKALAERGLPEEGLTLVAGRESVQELLAMHDLVDMVIPRGSKALVEYVQANTRIPVLGHSEGVCHIYVDRGADQELALRVIGDAKLDYPAACNAVETVLVHQEIATQFIPVLLKHLIARDVVVHGDKTVAGLLQDSHGTVSPVEDWHKEYGQPELSIGVVASMEEAIEHIHRYGSSHTESILTEDAETAERFLREVDAAGVFHNVSTRFADGYRYGFGAEVGISTSKLHARGPVGLEGLTTYKYVLRGRGHVVADYRGANARAFTHRRAGR